MQRPLFLQAMGEAYKNQNQYSQAIAVYQQALPAAQAAHNKRLEASILSRLSFAYYIQRDFEQSINFGQRALTLHRETENEQEQLKTLTSLGVDYLSRAGAFKERGMNAQANADYTSVTKLSQDALQLAKKLRNPQQEAKALTLLGSAYIFFKNFAQAESVLQQAVKIAHENHTDNELSALSSLTSVYVAYGNIQKQIEIQLRRVEIAREQHDRLSETLAFELLGANYGESGEFQKAIEAYRQAMVAAKQINLAELPPNLRENAAAHEFRILWGLSIVYVDFGQYDQALDTAQQAYHTAQALHRLDLETEALIRLAQIYESFQDFEKAAQASQQALEVARQIKTQAPKSESAALNSLSSAYIQQGKYALAEQAATQSLGIIKQLEDPILEQDALSRLSDIYDKQGNYAKALEYAQQRLAVAQKAKLQNFATTALDYLTRSYIAIGNTTRALEAAQQAVTLAQQQHNSSSEALGLQWLSLVYQARGEYDQGIETALMSQKLYRQNKSFLGEVGTAVVLSTMYEAVGDYQKVIAVAEPYLTLAQKIHDRLKEIELTLNLGNAYRLIGNYAKAKELLEQGLKSARELKIPRLESIALNNLGYYYVSLHDFQTGLNFAQQSLKIAQNLKSPLLLLSPQFNLGELYYNLGEYTKSREFYQQALATSQQLKNRQGEGIALLAQADTYFAEGNPQQTVALSQQALTIFQETKVPRLEAFAHRSLSIGYGELGDDAQAMASAQAFLAFARKVQNSVFEKDALTLLGELHHTFGRNQPAIAAYQQALAIPTDNQVAGANSGIYAGLAPIFRDANQSAIAIIYYKQAVKGIEQIRRSVEGLPPELQTSFLQAKYGFGGIKRADIYRQLADLLLKQDRVLEAQQVLDLLKVQELKDYLRTVRGTNQSLYELPPEQEILKKYNELQTSAIQLGQELANLRQIPEAQRTSTQQQRIVKLVKLQNELNQQFNAFTDRADVVALLKQLSPDMIRQSVDLQSLDALRDDLRQLNAVLLYPLILNDRLELVITTPDSPPLRRTVRVKREDLNAAIVEFRQALQDPSRNAKVPAQKLYEWLIKPLEADLKQAKAQTIIYAPDGPLRYIPLAALYDGQHWLVQRYRINNITAKSFTEFKTQPGSQPHVLAGAFTSGSYTIPIGDRRFTFTGLPFAKKEVDTLANLLPNTTKLIDQSFSRDETTARMNDYNIVHLATHASFVPGAVSDSFIVFGTGEKATLKDIASWTLNKVDLIVLSACETALGSKLGNGEEILGLGYQFQDRGAKATIASLWSVDDGGTQALMDAFYAVLKSGKMTKAEALQQAQIALITGDYTALGQKRGGIDIQPLQGALPKTVFDRLNHPYYWAPFILIGNGL